MKFVEEKLMSPQALRTDVLIKIKSKSLTLFELMFSKQLTYPQTPVSIENVANFGVLLHFPA